MSAYKLKDEEVSIVAVGSFNPGIFHPEWFIRHELLASEDLSDDVLKLDVVHPEVCRFKTWFSIEVTTTRFMLITKDLARSEELRNLASNIFNILPETPITALGFNSTFSVSCQSAEDWHHLGYSLAPRDVWLDALPEAEKDLGGVGMKSVEIEFVRWDDKKGAIRVIVQPSNSIPTPEASFRVNNHVDFKKMFEEDDSIIVANLVLNYWNESIELANRILTNFLGTIDEKPRV